MSFFYSVFGFLVAIAILVAVHEFGHFWVARKLGVKVLRFSVGFGKPLWKKVAGKDQVEYVIAAIPLGGYVKMLGDGDGAPIDPAEAHRAFDKQPIWKRSLIVVAGPGINFLFAIILFMVLGMQSEQRLVPVFGQFSEASAVAQAGVVAGDTLLEIDGRAVKHFLERDMYILDKVLKSEPIAIKVDGQAGVRSYELETAGIPIYKIDPAAVMRKLGFVPIAPPVSTTIGFVQEGSAAEQAGLLKGDRFVSIDNKAINRWQDLVDIVAPSAGITLPVTVERNGLDVDIQIVPSAKKIADKTVGLLGVGREPKARLEEQFVRFSRSPVQALVYGVESTWEMSVVTLRMLWKMVTFKVSPKNISGPITIADVAGQAVQISWDRYVFVLAAISISLGVMNLLPIPMLDGGHLLTYAVELVAGRSISEKFFIVGQKVGILLLLSLMSLAFYNDIFRLLN